MWHGGEVGQEGEAQGTLGIRLILRDLHTHRAIGPIASTVRGSLLGVQSQVCMYVRRRKKGAGKRQEKSRGGVGIVTWCRAGRLSCSARNMTKSLGWSGGDTLTQETHIRQHGRAHDSPTIMTANPPPTARIATHAERRHRWGTYLIGAGPGS